MADEIIETEFEKYFKLISGVVFTELKALQEDTNMEDIYFTDTISKSVASSISLIVTTGKTTFSSLHKSLKVSLKSRKTPMQTC